MFKTLGVPVALVSSYWWIPFLKKRFDSNLTLDGTKQVYKKKTTGPRKQVVSLEELRDVSNNSTIPAENDPGTTYSMETTLKRKIIKSNDLNKKPRK